MHLIISIFSKPEQSQGRLFNRAQSSFGLSWAHSLTFNLSFQNISFCNILTVCNKRGRKIRAALYKSFCLGIPTSRLISQIEVRQQKILIFHSRHIPVRHFFIFLFFFLILKVHQNISIICNYLLISEINVTRLQSVIQWYN